MLTSGPLGTSVADGSEPHALNNPTSNIRADLFISIIYRRCIGRKCYYFGAMSSTPRIVRSRLLQWSLAYLAAAWVLLQVLEFVAQQFGWPSGIVRAATVFAAIAFLAAVVVAWYHGEKGAQRVTPTEAVLLLLIFAGASVAATLVARDRAPANPKQPNAAEAEQGSVAVLPFANLSDSKDAEYFSDGMTEEIRNALANVEGLRVASRTSAFKFKGQQADIGEVARALNVSSVLEGSVRKAGDHIRITAQLVKAADGYHIWSDSYDADLKDIFTVQENIARAIVTSLRVKLAPAADQPLVRRGTESLEAYNLYLRANYLYNNYTEADLRRALQLYARATEIDPRFSDANAGTAKSWMALADDWVSPNEAYPKARAAALRALEIDSMNSNARTAFGMVLLAYEWRIADAARELQRGLGINGNLSQAMEWLALTHQFAKRYERAEQLLQQARRVDPLAAGPRTYLGRLHLGQRRWDLARDEANKLLASNPDYVMAYRILGDAYLGEGKPAEALAAFRAGLQKDAGLVRLRTGEVRALAALGQKEEARRRLIELEEENRHRYIRAEELAQAWAALGEHDAAFERLARALRDRSAGLLFLETWPAYDPLRSDPRFPALVRRVVQGS